MTSSNGENRLPTREDGTPYRPLLPAPLQVPADAYLSGERLVWKRSYQTAKVPSNLLVLFAGLSDATDDRIIRFARRFGVLELCGHDLPTSHWVDNRDGKLPCIPRLADDTYQLFWEPLDQWRIFARSVRAVISLSALLHDRRLSGPEAWADVLFAEESARGWQMVMGAKIEDDPPTLGANVDFDRAVLGLVVGQWLRVGDVRPRVSWYGVAPSVELSGWGLFGTLGVQLLQAVSRTEGASICSACGKLFFTKKRRNPNRRCFCDTCGIRGAWRMAARDSRASGS